MHHLPIVRASQFSGVLLEWVCQFQTFGCCHRLPRAAVWRRRGPSWTPMAVFQTHSPDMQPAGLRSADADIHSDLCRFVGSPLSGDDWRLASLGIGSGIWLGSRVFQLAATSAPRFGQLSIPSILTTVVTWPPLRVPCELSSPLGPASTPSLTPHPRSPCQVRLRPSTCPISFVTAPSPVPAVFISRRAGPPSAGAWPTATHIPSPLFRVALHAAPPPHALSCCGGGDRVLRHNAVRNIVCSAVAEFTLVALQLEKPGLLLSPPLRSGWHRL